jgi:hypothetical protein
VVPAAQRPQRQRRAHIREPQTERAEASTGEALRLSGGRPGTQGRPKSRRCLHAWTGRGGVYILYYIYTIYNIYGEECCVSHLAKTSSKGRPWALTRV